MIKKGFIISIILSIAIVFAVNQFISQSYYFLIVSFILIAFFNIMALKEKDLGKYVFFGFMVQAAYVLLDSSASALAGKTPFLGFLQLGNYLLAGLLFIISINAKNFNDFKMDNYSYAGILVSSLALAGLPGFNIFVSEFYIYSFAYSISPFFLGICFICSLMTLLAYLRIVSHSFFSKKSKIKSFPRKIAIPALCIICIILGAIPWIQSAIMGAIV